MGQTLSEPVTAKETSSCGNSMYKVGSSCMQGWRINMEDAHTHLLSVPEDKDCCFFAVYDGHGGAKIAQYAGNHLHKRIVQSEYFSKGDVEAAIRQGFLDLDQDMLSDSELKDELAGTTAIITILKNGKVYCGNAGDSRAVMSNGGLAEPLSYDHKPSNEEETQRIIAGGGWVEFNRVNGNLALSRALGDFIFKKNESKSAEEQIVTAYPDITIRDITTDHEFILLACDGIWDVLSNQEVVDFCRDRLAAKMEPETICEELLTRCLAPDCQMGGLGCDNMTVVLVCLLQGLSWEEYTKKCARNRPPTPPIVDDEDSPPLFQASASPRMEMSTGSTGVTNFNFGLSGSPGHPETPDDAANQDETEGSPVVPQVAAAVDKVAGDPSAPFLGGVDEDSPPPHLVPDISIPPTNDDPGAQLLPAEDSPPLTTKPRKVSKLEDQTEDALDNSSPAVVPSPIPSAPAMEVDRGSDIPSGDVVDQHILSSCKSSGEPTCEAPEDPSAAPDEEMASLVNSTTDVLADSSVSPQGQKCHPVGK